MEMILLFRPILTGEPKDRNNHLTSPVEFGMGEGRDATSGQALLSQLHHHGRLVLDL